MGDKLDLTEVIRQIENLQRAADRILPHAYRSQDGKGKINEGLLKQGNIYLDKARELIDQNIVPILQSLNPSQVTAALTAAGASSSIISQVSTALNAARAVAVSGMSTAAICEAINIAVPVLLAVVGIAILGFSFKWWLDRNIKKEGERALKQYQDQIAPRYRHVPFQPRLIPGNM